MKNTKINLSQWAVFFALIIMICIFGVTAKGFATWANLRNVLRQVSMYGICAVGMAMVIMTNGVDLSMSSTLAMANIVVALTLTQWGFPIWLSCMLCIAMGALIGAINGIWVNEIGMFPMIATMGMQILLRGVAYIISGGMPIYNIPEAFKVIGQGFMFGVVPVPVVIMLVLFTIGIFILTKTVYGRQIYAVGGNQEAARLAGISYKWVRYRAYIISGMCAAIAGIVYCSRVNSGQPAAGTGFEADIIPACVLGGVRLGGGEGNLFGVFIGVVFMGVLQNGMILFNLNEYWQMAIKGAVLLIAICFDRLSKESSNKRAVKAI